MTISPITKDALTRLEALPVSRELDLLWAKYERSVVLHGDETVESHYSKGSWGEERLQPLKEKIKEVTEIQMRTPEFKTWIGMFHLSRRMHPLFVRAAYHDKLLKRSDELTNKAKTLLKSLSENIKKLPQ